MVYVFIITIIKVSFQIYKIAYKNGYFTKEPKCKMPNEVLHLTNFCTFFD